MKKVIWFVIDDVIGPLIVLLMLVSLVSILLLIGSMAIYTRAYYRGVIDGQNGDAWVEVIGEIRGEIVYDEVVSRRGDVE